MSDPLPGNPAPPPAASPASASAAAPTLAPSPSAASTPAAGPASASSSAPAPGTAGPTSTTAIPNDAGAVKPKGAPVELTGFRSALSHTGIPHSVLTWKPKLPSRNWLIFWTITASLSSAYAYDRMECKRIKQATIAKVENQANEVMEGGSLGVPRKITVWGAKWGGDEDTDRALRYFRKYVKPYLVAAAIDYQLATSPLHGSITRQVHASILSQRRQSLGLEPLPPQLSLPGVLSPEEVKKKELEGGVVLVGRATLKEYMEGLRRGWTGDVNPWEWEKDIESKLENDGVFDEPKLEVQPLAQGGAQSEPVLADKAASDVQDSVPSPAAVPASATSSKPSFGLGFLSRPTPPQPSLILGDSSASASAPSIPAHLHIPPSPLPPQPPLLLLPFVNHIGFTQVPRMILSFFTERYRVQEGAEAALALINSTSRPITEADLEFDRSKEEFYNSAARETHKRIEQARNDYYDALKPKVDEARKYEMGERQLTDAEDKSGKVVRLDELREERKKKELRWMGNEEGWDIVKPEAEVAWVMGWENWLRVFELPKEKKE